MRLPRRTGRAGPDPPAQGPTFRAQQEGQQAGQRGGGESSLPSLPGTHPPLCLSLGRGAQESSVVQMSLGSLRAAE